MEMKSVAFKAGADEYAAIQEAALKLEISVAEVARMAVGKYLKVRAEGEAGSPMKEASEGEAIILTKLTEMQDDIDIVNSVSMMLDKLCVKFADFEGRMANMERKLGESGIQAGPKPSDVVKKKGKPSLKSRLLEFRDMVEGARYLVYMLFIMSFLGFTLGAEMMVSRLEKDTHAVMSEQIKIAVQESWERTAAMQRNVEARKREEAERQSPAKPDPKRVR